MLCAASGTLGSKSTFAAVQHQSPLKMTVPNSNYLTGTVSKYTFYNLVNARRAHAQASSGSSSNASGMFQ